MIRSFVVNKYIAKEFLKTIINMVLVFFSMSFIMNLFEEMNFFKDYDVSQSIPIMLSALVVPNLIYNMFPFIIFLSGIWFFLKIKKTDEIIAMKVSGMSNFSIIIIPGVLSLVLGIFLVTSVNPITSTLVKKYEMIKGTFEKDQEYLAAITENGIWIKERNLERNNIIRSKNLENNNLIDVTIYQFDSNNDFLQRIEAESADISSFKWILKNAIVISEDGKIVSNNNENQLFVSIYDIKKIKSLYSNLDTISFWSLENEIKLLEERGYSTREIETRLQRSLAFPFFLLSMVLLSGFSTLGISPRESNWNHLFIAIIACVLIYFFNDFSAALGKTERLPVQVAVWMPITIIFIFSSIGVINVNQK